MKVDDFRHYLHDYYRMVEDVDRQIGRVLSALRFRGLMENTVAVLTSDHGEGMGAHRWTQKAAFWEETAKVPLIVAGKGIERRGAVDSRTLASGADIVPTLCDYAGASPPARVAGVSLRPAIQASRSAANSSSASSPTSVFPTAPGACCAPPATSTQRSTEEPARNSFSILRSTPAKCATWPSRTRGTRS